MSKMELEAEVEFFSRVVNIPLVSSAITYASGAYHNAKDSSPVLIKRTLSKAEDTAKYAAQLAAPVVQTLERPIHVVDTLACKTLDKMEDSLPAITHTPEQIMESTRNYVNEKLQPVQNKVDLVCNMGNELSDRISNNPLGGFVLNSIQSTVSTAHNYIDYYIPPAEAEPAKEGDASEEAVPSEAFGKVMWTMRRSLDIPFKVHRRLSGHVQRQLHDIGVIGLTYTGTLIECIEWGQRNLKEVQTVGVSGKLHLMAVQYANDNGLKQPSTTKEDLVILSDALSRQTAGLIRTTVVYAAALSNSERIKALRTQLFVVINGLVDFVNQMIATVQSSDLMDDTSRAYLQNVIQKTTGFVQEFNKQLLSRVSQMKLSF